MKEVTVKLDDKFLKPHSEKSAESLFLHSWEGVTMTPVKGYLPIEKEFKEALTTIVRINEKLHKLHLQVTPTQQNATVSLREMGCRSHYAH